MTAGVRQRWVLSVFRSNVLGHSVRQLRYTPRFPATLKAGKPGLLGKSVFLGNPLESQDGTAARRVVNGIDRPVSQKGGVALIRYAAMRQVGRVAAMRRRRPPPPRRNKGLP
jgi:hypothetical protein